MRDTNPTVQGSLRGRDRSASASSSSSSEDEDEGADSMKGKCGAKLDPPLALTDSEIGGRLRKFGLQHDEDDGELEICIPATALAAPVAPAESAVSISSELVGASSLKASPSDPAVSLTAPAATPRSAMDAYLEAVASLESKARKTEGENSVLALAMQNSVERVLSGVNDDVKPSSALAIGGSDSDAFGAIHGTANKVAEEPARRQPVSSDSFGIVYKPFKKPQSEYKAPGAAFEDEFDFEVDLKKSTNTVAPIATSIGQEDDDFDFESDVNAANVLHGKTIKETIEAALARETGSSDPVIATESSESREIMVDKITVINGNNNSSEPTDAGAAESVAPTFDASRLLNDAREALRSYTEVYEQGLGDQEVEIIKSFGTLHPEHELEASVASAPAPTATARRTLAAEAIEEGDEEGHEEAERAELQSALLARSEEARLASEWDLVGGGSGVVVADDGGTIIEPETEAPVSYELLLAALRSMDVSKFESSLVLQSLGWWPLGYPKLSFAGSDASEEEKFVFSCAMIDYEPSVHAIHLAALRRIFMVLTDDPGLVIPPLGPHWENIGFQGLDPRTDINRSMKMFAVLQVLHLVEYFPSFAKDMHQLSCLHLRNASGEVIKDLTWPFFCVSIGFTKHAIQTFRSGALNKECNKKQDILSVLHEYHRACFSAFSRDLRKNGDVHHAVHLSNLSKLVESDPKAVLKQYRAQTSPSPSEEPKSPNGGEEVVQISDISGFADQDESQEPDLGASTRTKNYEISNRK